MSPKATLDRQDIQKFNTRFGRLMEVYPEARATAVKAMGQAAQQELNAQIGKADLETDAKGTVSSWQELRLGSEGGYAAISPKAYKWSYDHGKGKPKFWKSVRVSTRMVTKWLERGHGVRKADTTKAYAWSQRRKNRIWRSGVNKYTGLRYVKGRMFYSWTKLKARNQALDAATEAMNTFAKETLKILKTRSERYQ